MQITKSSLDTTAGPADWFTAVFVDIAIQEADDFGSPVTWGRHLTDEEYGTGS